MMDSVYDFLTSDAQESLTSIDVSIESHVMALAAEYSRLHNGTCVNLDNFAKNANTV